MQHLVEEDGLEVRLGLLLHEGFVEQESVAVRGCCGDVLGDTVRRVEEQSAKERRLSEQFHSGFY